jgi:hypothetical protein
MTYITTAAINATLTCCTRKVIETPMPVVMKRNILDSTTSGELDCDKCMSPRHDLSGGFLRISDGRMTRSPSGKESLLQ